MAATRATLRVAISQLADQFSGARPEKLLRPTVIDRAPWEIIPDKLTVYRVDFLLRRGARGDYPYELELRSGRAGRPYAGQAVPSGTRDWPSGRETFFVRAPGEIIPDKLIVYRVDFLLRRAVLLGTRTGPADCNLHCPRAGGNRPNNSRLFGRFPTPAVARGCRSALEIWNWLGNKLELPLRRAGGAFRHSVGAIRARKTGKNNPGKTPGRARPQGVLLA